MRLYQDKHQAAKWLEECFQDMNWKWSTHSEDDERIIPKYKDIIKFFDFLKDSIVKNDLVSCSSGRIIVIRTMDYGIFLYGMDQRNYDKMRRRYEY